jgi:BRCT domain type II-containing protein
MVAQRKMEEVLSLSIKELNEGTHSQFVARLDVQAGRHEAARVVKDQAEKANYKHQVEAGRIEKLMAENKAELLASRHRAMLAAEGYRTRLATIEHAIDMV